MFKDTSGACDVQEASTSTHTRHTHVLTHVRHTYAHACTQVHVGTHTNAETHLCMCTYMHAHGHIQDAHACLCAHSTHRHMHVQSTLCTHLCTHTCAQAYTSTCVHTLCLQVGVHYPDSQTFRFETLVDARYPGNKMPSKHIIQNFPLIPYSTRPICEETPRVFRL